MFRQLGQHMSRLRVLKMDVAALAKVSGLDENTVHELKKAMLAKRFEVGPVPKGLEKLASVTQPSPGKSKRGTSRS
jgi:hypothetical protein